MINNTNNTSSISVRRTLTEARRSYARMAYQNGSSVKDIAKTLGVTCNCVRDYYLQDLRPKRKQLSQEDVMKILDMRNRGLKVIEIAGEMGVSSQTISRRTAHLMPHLKDRVNDMFIMREIGLTNAEIAKRINANRYTIRKYIGKQPKAMTLRSLRAAGAARKVKNHILKLSVSQFEGNELPKSA